MEKGKTRKYLTYAIGEIVLVVLGILIALQINSWNQYKKDRLEEKNILSRIEKDLKADIADLNIQIKRNKLYMDDLQFIIDGIITKNLILTDFVEKNKSYSRYNYFEQIAGTYKESLASGKLSLITSDSLRNQILKHYEVFEIGTDEVIKNQMRDFILPTFYKSFADSKEYIEFISEKPNNIEPIDLNTVYNNKDYLKATTVKLALLKGQNIQYSGQIDRTKKIINAIHIELNNRWTSK